MPTDLMGLEYGGLSEVNGSVLLTAAKSRWEMGENTVLGRCVGWTGNFEEQVS